MPKATPPLYERVIPSIWSRHRSLPKEHGCGVYLDDGIEVGDAILESDLKYARLLCKYLEAVHALGVDPGVTQDVVNTAGLRVKAIELSQLQIRFGMGSDHVEPQPQPALVPLPRHPVSLPDIIQFPAEAMQSLSLNHAPRVSTPPPTDLAESAGGSLKTKRSPNRGIVVARGRRTGPPGILHQDVERLRAARKQRPSKSSRVIKDAPSTGLESSNGSGGQSTRAVQAAAIQTGLESEPLSVGRGGSKGGPSPRRLVGSRQMAKRSRGLFVGGLGRGSTTGRRLSDGGLDKTYDGMEGIDGFAGTQM